IPGQPVTHHNSTFSLSFSLSFFPVLVPEPFMDLQLIFLCKSAGSCLRDFCRDRNPVRQMPHSPCDFSNRRSTKLQGRWRLSSCCSMMPCQAVLHAPVEPGMQNTAVLLLRPAKALDWIVDVPISLNDSCRNNSPNPSIVE